MKPAVESPSHRERDASIGLIVARSARAWPVASTRAPTSSMHITPRTKMTSPTGYVSRSCFTSTSLTVYDAMQPQTAAMPRWLLVNDRLPARRRDWRSAAGHAHVAGQRRALVPPVDDEVMSLGLAGDGL